jgi:formylmethanofuran dehydrogenase subunit B
MLKYDISMGKIIKTKSRGRNKNEQNLHNLVRKLEQYQQFSLLGYNAV